MALQSSGEISLNDIETEFGGTPPTAISEYYGSASGVPTSGQISVSDFYGTSASFYNHQIDYSLRFEDGSSAYLSRSQSTGNRRTYTTSMWIKRSYVGSGLKFMFNAGGGGTECGFFFRDDYFEVSTNGGTSLKTSSVYRDTSAWYHVVVAFDTTQATSSERIRAYINGTRLTAFSTASYPGQNTDTYVNTSGYSAYVGRLSSGNSYHFDGYIAEVNHVDGQALAPSYFGEEKYGVWIPKAYSGSYGTNGFYLKFANSASLGTDSSGNGNNWTPTNLGATDQMLDTPTNNFCTISPLHFRAYRYYASEGNLKTQSTASNVTQGTSWALQSGKWYAEFVCSADSYPRIGVFDQNETNNNMQGSSTITYGGHDGAGNAEVIVNGSKTGYTQSPRYYAGDIVGIAYDADTRKVWFSKNGTWLNFAGSGANPATGTNAVSTVSGSSPVFIGFRSESVLITCNFGQDSSFAGNKTAQNNTDANGYGDFYYTPPTGFLALCTANLTVAAGVDPGQDAKPTDHFNVKLWTGNGSSQNITGYGFNPDLIWIKKRSGTDNNDLTDRVRGANKRIYSNTSGSEETGTTGFITDGVSLGSNGTTNESGYTYVGWGWKANNTSGSSNTSGSITSTVSANPDAGFSIVSYTGSGNSNNSVGHGLSQAPEFVMCKMRSDSEHWCGYHKTYGANYKFRLNSTLGALSDNVFPTNPTSSVFYVAATGNSENNGSGRTYIAYCFHSVDGYSKFGSYKGNGSSDGPFVYTGFRPRWLLIKNTTGYSWILKDTARDTRNVAGLTLVPNASDAESAAGNNPTDFLSNGFKLREGSVSINSNGTTYIYMAFAEQPFKYANAR